MRTRFLLRFVLVVIPIVGLMLLWLSVLPRQGQAAPVLAAGEAASYGPGDSASASVRADPRVRPSPTPTPDPRWIEIVRSRESRGNSPSAQALTINLNLTDQFAAGRVPSAAPVDITVTDQGYVLSDFSVMPVFDGSSFSYLVSHPYEGDLLPGYALWVSQGAAVISMTVPTLTALAYPQTDILSGTAPVNAGLVGYMFAFMDPDQVYTTTTTASGAGTYQMDWSTVIDLRPRDSGYLLYAQDDARQTYIRFVAPYLRVQVGGSVLYGAAAPQQVVDLVTKDNTGATLDQFSTYTGSNGYFIGSPCESYGSTAFLPSYQVIAVAGGQTFSVTVVNLTAQADMQGGQVSGQAPASQPVEIWVFDGPLQEGGSCAWYDTPFVQVTVTATVDGGYAAPLPLRAGNYGIALVTTSEGNQVFVPFVVPYLNARLGGPFEFENAWQRMWGQVAEPNAPITVEVQGPSGYLKDWYTLRAMDNGYFFDLIKSEPGLILESGDRITLTTPHETQIVLLLPVLTAEADLDTNIVSGQAPPFSQVSVSLLKETPLTATVDAQGQYAADFSSLGGIYGGEWGEVTWTNADGYGVVRYFLAPAPPGGDCIAPYLGSAQVGGNELFIVGSFNCGSITFRLRGSDGMIKFEKVFANNPGDLLLYDENGHPVIIAPGDQIEIEGGGLIAPTPVPTGFPGEGRWTGNSASQPEGVTVVPNFSLNLDPQTDRASGQAPPLAVIALGYEYQAPLLTTTASAQGAFTADLSGYIDLDAGSYLRAALDSSPFYYTIGVIPLLETNLYFPWIGGRLQPLSPYTVTLSSAITVTAPVTGFADAVGRYMASPYPPPGGFRGNPEDRVEVETPTRVWEMILPFLTARVDASTGVVSGQAPPGSRLLVQLYAGDAFDYSTIITATAGGTYSVAFPVPGEPMPMGGSVTHFSAFDMRTSLHFSTPSWRVTLGAREVTGFAGVYGGPITVTLQSTNGRFTQAITQTVSQDQFWVVFQRPVYPGDRLTVETPGGLASDFTVPYVSAVYDFVRHVLEGRAPAGIELYASIPNGNSYAFRHVRLLPDGSYGVDASDLNPLVGQQGYVDFTDELGNMVICPFTVRGYPWYLPLISLLASFP